MGRCNFIGGSCSGIFAIWCNQTAGFEETHDDYGVDLAGGNSIAGCSDRAADDDADGGAVLVCVHPGPACPRHLDKLPRTPNRTDPGPLAARLVFGGLVGAIAATGLRGPALEGVILGVTGALIGAFGGYLVRRELVQLLNCKDWQIAVAEDALALGCAVLAMGVVTG
jgi:hypothetical protein